MAEPDQALAVRLRQAFADKDLVVLGTLLTDDVRWGDDDHPRRCRSRNDVVATFSRLIGEGVGGEIASLEEGPGAVLCELAVRWPTEADRRRGQRFFHVYHLRDGRICEIRRFDDRRSAREAAGLGA